MASDFLLDRLGLPDTGAQPVREFSGGMKRRLALARALLAPFDALALDEPFTGLDRENRDLALKTLFFARDIRGGLGERRVFRIIFHWLALFAPEAAEKNLPLVPDYGRYDDLLELLGTPCEKQAVSFFQQQLEADERSAKEGQPVSLLAK